jgi:hypothetical protein
LIAWRQSAPGEFGESSADDARPQALPAMRRGGDHSAHFPYRAVILERQAGRHCIAVALEHASEGFAVVKERF